MTDALAASDGVSALADALREAVDDLVMFHNLGWTEPELNGALRGRVAVFHFDNPRPIGTYLNPGHVPPAPGIRFRKPADDAPEDVWNAWLESADHVAAVTNDASLARLAAQLRTLGKQRQSLP